MSYISDDADVRAAFLSELREISELGFEKMAMNRVTKELLKRSPEAAAKLMKTMGRPAASRGARAAAEAVKEQAGYKYLSNQARQRMERTMIGAGAGHDAAHVHAVARNAQVLTGVRDPGAIGPRMKANEIGKATRAEAGALRTPTRSAAEAFQGNATALKNYRQGVVGSLLHDTGRETEIALKNRAEASAKAFHGDPAAKRALDINPDASGKSRVQERLKRYKSGYKQLSAVDTAAAAGDVQHGELSARSTADFLRKNRAVAKQVPGFQNADVKNAVRVHDTDNQKALAATKSKDPRSLRHGTNAADSLSKNPAAGLIYNADKLEGFGRTGFNRTMEFGHSRGRGFEPGYRYAIEGNLDKYQNTVQRIRKMHGKKMGDYAAGKLEDYYRHMENEAKMRGVPLKPRPQIADRKKMQFTPEQLSGKPWAPPGAEAGKLNPIPAVPQAPSPAPSMAVPMHTAPAAPLFAPNLNHAQQRGVPTRHVARPAPAPQPAPRPAPAPVQQPAPQPMPQPAARPVQQPAQMPAARPAPVKPVMPRPTPPMPQAMPGAHMLKPPVPAAPQVKLASQRKVKLSMALRDYSRLLAKADKRGTKMKVIARAIQMLHRKNPRWGHGEAYSAMMAHPNETFRKRLFEALFKI